MASRWLMVVMLCAWCLSCFPELDGGARGAADAATSDGAAPDGMAPDGTALDAIGRDASIHACGLPQWLDVEAFAKHRGRTTVLTIDRTETFPSAVRPTPRGCEADAPGAAVAAVRYTARSDAWLRVEAASYGDHADHLWVAADCEATAEVLGCEGRVARTPDRAREVGALRTRRPLRRAEVVWIFLASIPGDGELTITEIPEVVPLGGGCDPSEVSGVCAEGSSCVASGGAPRCVVDGREGARCRPDFSCDAPLRCARGEGTASTARCVTAAPLGAWCGDLGGGHPVHCVEGTCIDERCRRDGTYQSACRASDPRCDDGMVCEGRSAGSAGRCLRRLDAGAPCGDGGAACPEGESCVFPLRGAPRCTPRGTEGALCRERGRRCDDGLYCFDGGALSLREQCVRMPERPRPCGPGNTGCAPGEACFTGGDVTWCAPGIPHGQTCYAAHGGCLPGLACARGVGQGFGRCWEETPLRPELQPCGASGRTCPLGWHCYMGMACLEDRIVGAACEEWNGPRCAADLHCARAIPTVHVDTCRASGTPNAWCRDGSPACDAGGRCIWRGGPLCAPTLRVGDDCARIRFAESDYPPYCPAGTWCARTSANAPDARCAALGDLGGPCRATGSPCGAGLRCDDGVCVEPVAPGATCDELRRCPTGHWCAATDALGEFRCAAPGEDRGPCRDGATPCDGGARCLVGRTHRLDPAVERYSLLAREAFPIAPHCEARPEVPRVVCAYTDSQRVFHPQRLCPADRFCSDQIPAPTCDPAGALRQYCRFSAPRCDDGLVCAQGGCVERIPPGAGCGGHDRESPRCVYPQACVGGAPTGSRCIESPMQIEVTVGGQTRSICGDPLRIPAAPMPFRFLGAEFDVSVDAGGGPVIRPLGATPATLRPSVWVGNSVGWDYGDVLNSGRCARVEGDAPRRRAVFMAGPARVELSEGSGEVAITYGPEPSRNRAGTPVVASPEIALGADSILAHDITVTEGTVVRFIPR